MRYTAIVPARSGSKRLPNKNIKMLGGKPLVVWTLEACIGSAKIDRVILSTDSLAYWELVQRCIPSPKLRLDLRDENDAGDTVKIFDYIKNSRAKIFSGTGGAFLLALPTVPLRTSSHIDEAIARFEKLKRPVFSATDYGFPTSFAFRLDGNEDWKAVEPDNPMITGNTRSQNQTETYHPNGAIYVREIADLSDENLHTFYTGAVPYIMDRSSSIDIDTEQDFKVAEALLR